jgi:L-lysine 2,3-aminomutase
LERVLLPLLGLFPWECRFCQRKVYLRARGETRHAH